MASEKTKYFSGEGISDGICIAPIVKIQKKDIKVPKYPAADREAEEKRFLEAYDTALLQLKTLYEEALRQLTEKEAAIFDAHISILEDQYSVSEPIISLIKKEGYNAAHAVETQFDNIIDMFRSLHDELMSERAVDAGDIKRRLLRIILGIEEQDLSHLDTDVVIAAKELVPSDTMKMDLKHVAGIITYIGGQTAHTAIIARSLGIPAVSAVPVHRIRNGSVAVVYGNTGRVITDPSEEDIKALYEQVEAAKRHEKEISVYINRESISADNRRFEISANIGTPKEAESALEFGADGIGLFRSEFLYMNRDTIPDEEEQYKEYAKAVSAMNGRPVIIRTLDVGGDKKLPGIKIPREDNPFLGLRAIRLCLGRPEMFKTQLKALLRAASEGNLKIMFPMISSLSELKEAKALLKEAEDELIKEGKKFGPVKTGIMVEIPSAAVMADVLAKEVDFFSIGTNDLVQYTLAAERGNRHVSYISTPFDPAVLRLIANTAKAASDNNIMCGMCGEAAGKAELIPVWAGLGLTELSMSPRLIPEARHIICNLDTRTARETALAALSCSTAAQVKELLES